MSKLERWESWPLWALGLSNGLNIALGYILSDVRLKAPELSISVLPQLIDFLPVIVVIAGIAAAVSLDGVLIATIAGMRHGRQGVWSVLTIIGAALFSGAFAYALHADVLDQAPALHVAQAVVLALYNLHLSQPRKALQADLHLHRNSITDTVQLDSDAVKAPHTNGTHHDGFRCRSCGQVFDSTSAVKAHRLSECTGTKDLVKIS